jgi:release factor glutamine methyltransferase
MLQAENKTISGLLQEATLYLSRKKIPFPRQEAEQLLSSLLSLRRIDLYIAPNQPVSSEQESRFWNQVHRRGAHEPLQYILGEVEFDGFSFLVQSGVFIPRPETELIVEFVLKQLPPPKVILDLCTGSGALAVALARRFPASNVVAADCSEVALSVARLNAKRNQCLSRILFLEGDLFEPLQKTALFDLIVCNPPYIAERDRPGLEPEVRDYEPAAALFAPNEGTAFYRRILQEVQSFLAPGGHLLLELGAGQSAWFERFVKEETGFSARLIPDLAGIDRIAVCTRLQGEMKGRGAEDG